METPTEKEGLLLKTSNNVSRLWCEDNNACLYARVTSLLSRAAGGALSSISAKWLLEQLSSCRYCTLKTTAGVVKDLYMETVWAYIGCGLIDTSRSKDSQSIDKFPPLITLSAIRKVLGPM